MLKVGGDHFQQFKIAVQKALRTMSQRYQQHNRCIEKQ